MTYRTYSAPPIDHLRALRVSILTLAFVTVFTIFAPHVESAIDGINYAPTHLTVSTTLVVNEIDYDQPSTDDAEFIEIKNISAGAINLDTYDVELVNGDAGGATVYRTIDLPNVSLPAGDYYVVCVDAANVPNCDLDHSLSINLLQNGAPDAVAIVTGGTVIDTVSYEGDTGSPYTEGSGSGLVDDGSADYEGLSRLPDGADTDQNNVDLSLRCISPGEANVSTSSSCPAPTGPGTPTVTATSAASPTLTPAATATWTSTPDTTATETPVGTATSTGTPAATVTVTPASTAAPTDTPEPTPPDTATPAPSTPPPTETTVPPTSPPSATAAPTIEPTSAPSATSEPTATALAAATATEAVLAVQMLDVAAERTGSVVIVSWRTASEIDNAGFHVWRAGKGDKPLRVTHSLIPPAGGVLGGAAYTYRDARAPVGPTHYWVEDVDVFGRSTWHGPVVATAIVLGTAPMRHPATTFSEPVAR